MMNQLFYPEQGRRARLHSQFQWVRELFKETLNAVGRENSQRCPTCNSADACETGRRDRESAV